MSLFAELKRRNVFRVGIAYVVLAWLLLQVGDTLAPAPDEIVATEAGQPSIAVLPFENMSSDAEQEYFSDGLTEELLDLRDDPRYEAMVERMGIRVD